MDQFLVLVGIKCGHGWAFIGHIEHSVSHGLVLGIGEVGHELVQLGREVIPDAWTAVKVFAYPVHNEIYKLYSLVPRLTDFFRLREEKSR